MFDLQELANLSPQMATATALLVVLVQKLITPVVIQVVAALKSAGRIPSGTTPLYALLIGGLLGVIAGGVAWAFLDPSGTAMLGITLFVGLLMGLTAGGDAVGVHQVGQKREDKAAEQERLVETAKELLKKIK